VRGVVLIGDAGVGKTTLARAVTAALPIRVQWFAATASARSIPLGVFAHLVGSATSRDPVAFLAEARKAILAHDSSILGIDDAHMLDQLSATLLHQLALEGSIRIVATIREGETVPDAITSLWKDGFLLRLHLDPFDRRQCLRLIEAALGGRVEELSADLMWKASGGNALFVRHLVEGALEAGTLRQLRGVWQLRGRTAVTSELASLLEDRIEQLPPGVLHALGLLTFCEPLDLDVLTRLVGGDAVEQAEARGLIRVAEQQHCLEVHFTHPLFGDVIRRRTGIAAARRIRGELVRALAAEPTALPAQRIRLAELTLDSDQAVDCGLLVHAAQDAIALTDITLGERLARAAVAHGGGLPASELLARALLWSGKAPEAEQTLAAFDSASMSDQQLVRWGAARIANLQWSLGDAEAATELLTALRARVTRHGLRLFLDALGAASAAFQNRLDEAVALARDVLDDPTAAPVAIEWAVIGGGLAFALSGDFPRAARIAERGRAVELDVDGMLHSLSAFGEILALVLSGEFDAAQQRGADVVQISSPGQYVAWGMANVLLGAVAIARGRFQLAVRKMEETVAALTAESAASWSFPARIYLAQAYCALGQVDAGRKMVAELNTRLGEHVAVFEPQLRLTEAWLAAAEGNVSTAVDRCTAAAGVARDSGQHAIELVALYDAVRFGDQASVARIAELADSVGGRLAPLYHAHARGVAEGDPTAIYTASQAFESVGALLPAADAAAQAASEFRVSGRNREAIEAAAAADRLAEVCGGIRSPALDLAAQPLPLTRREREVAEMIANGFTTRDIADRLFVSPRTVEGHIYKACIKLGVSDREALVELIRSSRKRRRSPG
jgi:DNA-binding CsgD family transcriptional regulator